MKADIMGVTWLNGARASAHPPPKAPIQMMNDRRLTHGSIPASGHPTWPSLLQSILCSVFCLVVTSLLSSSQSASQPAQPPVEQTASKFQPLILIKDLDHTLYVSSDFPSPASLGCREFSR